MISRRLSRRLIRHHAGIAALGLASSWALYVTRPYPDVLTRLSFATAYPALVFAMVALLIGPWNYLATNRLPVSIDLRRDFGIWAGIFGIVHAIVGQFVHFRGRPWLYYIYEDWRQRGVAIRHDLFGFTNFTGLAAALILIALLATSNDLSLRALGTPRWKQLQRWNYACFALAALHTFGFQVIEKQKAPFVTIAVLCISIALSLQLIGFVRRRNFRFAVLDGRPLDL
jgi:sulfoxide reductase heme-binding subunit YedZ